MSEDEREIDVDSDDEEGYGGSSRHSSGSGYVFFSLNNCSERAKRKRASTL